MSEEKAKKSESTKTADEKAFKDHQEKRFAKITEFRKRLKWYHIVAAAIVLAIILLFVIWHLIPKKVMSIAVLDKTVLSYADDENIVKDTVYRKHQGFFWILNQQRYVKPDGSRYDYTRDYFGPMLDEEGDYDHSVEFSDADSKPDMVYLADAYGLGNDTYGHYNGSTPLGGGISDDDMSYISFAYESGAPIVAEATLFSSPLSDSVRSQLTSLLGVNPTKWIGRYLVDLQDFTDVPDWAVPMYEQQEGVEWRFTGPGILLVSSDGEIIILEQNTDFSSQNLMQIYINEEYKKEFGSCGRCNFYNWFELVEPGYGVDNIATFEFDLNATGMEKIREISKVPRFCAIARKQVDGYAPVYFFAGDFNDYVSGKRYGDFLFANQFFRFMSYDRQGDISNFFWRFYDPLICRILHDTRTTKYIEDPEDHAEVSRVNGGSFQVLEEGKWHDLNMKATAINACKPGEDKYSRDFTFYDELVGEASELGVNCLEAKSLLPPEFYAAVSRHNKTSDNKIYILQRITPPDDLEPKDYLTEAGIVEWEKTITAAVKALHGNSSAEGGKLGRSTYFIDISNAVLGISVDPGLDSDMLKELGGIADYSYSGRFVRESRGVNGFAARLYDIAQTVSYDNYGYYTPIAVCGKLDMLKGMSFVRDKSAYFINDIAAAECSEYYYNDIALDCELLNGLAQKDDTLYANYNKALAELNQLASPVLASGICFSNVNAVYSQKAVTEQEQGAAIVDALTAAKDSTLLGATVYDLDDCWGDSDENMSFFTAGSNGYLWHNTCDRTQMTGLIALDSTEPDEPGLVLSDDDLVQAVSMNSDEGYMYITLQLFEEIDYKTNAMFVGIDTYQRNDGEYYYAKDFTPNSLSGMEYTLRFDGKQKAALYVTPYYNRTTGSAYTKESYTGNYDKVADLTYGGFTSGDNQFYQTGSTVYIRLPWTWLNVADPSKKLVINDTSFGGDRAKTVTTNGALISVMIGERKEGDLIYAFPEDKHDPGYKVFQWKKWETATFVNRRKESFDILKKYFSQH